MRATLLEDLPKHAMRGYLRGKPVAEWLAALRLISATGFPRTPLPTGRGLHDPRALACRCPCHPEVVLAHPGR